MLPHETIDWQIPVCLKLLLAEYPSWFFLYSDFIFHRSHMGFSRYEGELMILRKKDRKKEANEQFESLLVLMKCVYAYLFVFA